MSMLRKKCRKVMTVLVTLLMLISPMSTVYAGTQRLTLTKTDAMINTDTYQRPSLQSKVVAVTSPGRGSTFAQPEPIVDIPFADAKEDNTIDEITQQNTETIYNSDEDTRVKPLNSDNSIKQAVITAEPLMFAAESSPDDGSIQAMETNSTGELSALSVTNTQTEPSPLSLAIDAGLAIGQPVLLYFTAAWCGYCQDQKVIFDELEQEYGDRVLFILADESEHYEDLETWDVTGFPTTFLIAEKTGTSYVYEKFTGLTEKDILASSLNQLLESSTISEGLLASDEYVSGDSDGATAESTSQEGETSGAGLMSESLLQETSDDVYIAITDQGFQPYNVFVTAGQRIHWTNDTSETHTITAHNNLFDSAELPPGGGFSITLAVPGTHTYGSLHNTGFSGVAQVMLTEIPGSPTEPVIHHIPNIPFPLASFGNHVWISLARRS